jgi:hypothetical protein
MTKIEAEVNVEGARQRAVEDRRVSLGLKSDAAGFRSRRLHELTDGIEEGLDMSIMARHDLLQFGKLSRQLFVRRHDVAQPDEGADDKHAHLDGVRTIEHVGRHDCPMLGKGIG